MAADESLRIRKHAARDLLDAPWLQVKELLPQDGEAYRQQIRHGSAWRVARPNQPLPDGRRIRSARSHGAKRETAGNNHQTLLRPGEQRAFTNHVEFSQFNTASERATFPLLGNSADVAVLKKEAPMTVGAADPAKRELESMGVVASSYEPLEIRFNQFKAPVPGRYKLRLSAHSFWAGPESEAKWWHPSRTEAFAGRTREPITLYAEIPPRQMRYLANRTFRPNLQCKKLKSGC